MEPPNNLEPELEAVFGGVPVIVRLLTQDDVLCVLYQPRDANDSRMFMERPLRIVMEEMGVESSEEGPHRERVLVSKVRARFDRWMPFTTAAMFPLYNDHVMSIAPVADQYIPSYIEWADRLYTYQPEVSSPRHATEKLEPTSDDIRNSYIDFLIHSDTPKGKPN